MASEPPVLYHLAISHYSEKARWALSWKGVRHVRRSTIGGMHVGLSLWLTRGEHYTMPVMRMDERVIGDSTQIIAALEEAYPEPPLYPSDPAERERALELEDFFDEELGPYIRRFAFAELSRDPEALGEVIVKQLPEPMASSPAVAAAIGKQFVRHALRRGPVGGVPRRRGTGRSRHSTASRPSWTGTSTSSATRSASPTSARPPSFILRCCRRRGRTCRRPPRAWRRSAPSDRAPGLPVGAGDVLPPPRRALRSLLCHE